MIVCPVLGCNHVAKNAHEHAVHQAAHGLTVKRNLP